MKKFTLLFATLLMSFGAFAQFHVTSNFGEINDGDTLNFGTINQDQASVVYEIHNDAEEPIHVRLKVVSLVNTDGSKVEICLGQCYYSVQEGMTYPAPNFDNGQVTVEPGQTQPAEGDHFWNFDDTGLTPGNPIAYVLQFQQLDMSGSFPNHTLTFTYRYVPEMGVQSFHKDFDVQILNTVVNNGQLSIKNQNPVGMQIYNLLGQRVEKTQLKGGMNTVNVGNLASQVYLVRFHNAKGQTKTQKIVVK